MTETCPLGDSSSCCVLDMRCPLQAHVFKHLVLSWKYYLGEDIEPLGDTDLLEEVCH